MDVTKAAALDRFAQSKNAYSIAVPPKNNVPLALATTRKKAWNIAVDVGSNVAQEKPVSMDDAFAPVEKPIVVVLALTLQKTRIIVAVAVAFAQPGKYALEADATSKLGIPINLGDPIRCGKVNTTKSAARVSCV